MYLKKPQKGQYTGQLVSAFYPEFFWMLQSFKSNSELTNHEIVIFSSRNTYMILGPELLNEIRPS